MCFLSLPEGVPLIPPRLFLRNPTCQQAQDANACMAARGALVDTSCVTYATRLLVLVVGCPMKTQCKRSVIGAGLWGCALTELTRVFPRTVTHW